MVDHANGIRAPQNIASELDIAPDVIKRARIQVVERPRLADKMDLVIHFKQEDRPESTEPSGHFKGVVGGDVVEGELGANGLKINRQVEAVVVEPQNPYAAFRAESSAW